MSIQETISLYYKRAFWLVASLFFLIGLARVGNYGLNFDDALHASHGWILYDFYSGKSKAAQLSPYNDKGELITAFEGEKDLRGMNVFPGAFDLLAQTVHRNFNETDLFVQRHYLIFLFGFTAILFAGLTAVEIGGWRAGLITLLMGCCSPRLIGHLSNNPKDIPFAGLYVLSVFFLVKWYKSLPALKWHWLVAMLVAATLACDVRISGLTLFIWLFIFTAVKWMELKRNGAALSNLNIALSGVAVVAGIIIAYYGISLLWPYAQTDPWQVPLRSLKTLSNFNVFNSYDLYDGRHVSNKDEPWNYILVWEAIGNPVFVVLSAFLFPLVLVLSRQKVVMGLIGLISFAPLAISIIKGSYFPHDGRHFFFLYCVALICFAMVWETLLLEIPKTKWRNYSIAALFLVFFIEPIVWITANHPNEMCYFNPVFGGVKAAWGKYETDYYGNCLKACVDYIQQHSHPDAQHPVRVRVYYGSQSSSEYFLMRVPNYKYVAAIENSLDWDYSILLTAACKYDNKLFEKWPPINTVYEEKAGGVPLAAVYHNYRLESPEGIKIAVNNLLNRNPHPENKAICAEALNYAKDYDGAIALCDSVLLVQPQNITALKQEAIAYDFKRNDKSAAYFYEKYLAVNPNDPPVAMRLKNLKGIVDEAGAANATTLIVTMVNQSLEAYNQGDFGKCVSLCKAALRIDSNQIVALNNLCASYNALQQFDEAEKACRRALQVNPGYELAKNNLKITQLKKAELKKK
ncbi:MAG: hypothetical protein U0T73_09340 [Chitinophagales bacterium]